MSSRPAWGARSMALAMAILAGLALTACRRAGGTLVVTGGTLIDGTGGPPTPDAVLVLREGRIECAGPADSCPIPPGSATLRAAGKWIVPGLIDTHTHPRWGQNRARTIRNERLRFLLGVTTSRDASTNGELQANLAEAPRTRMADQPVPRLLVAGRIGVETHDSEEARRAVRDLKARGATAVKLKDALPDSILRAIATTADSVGLPVYGHAWDERPIRSRVIESVDAGFTGLAHMLGIAPLAVPTEDLDHPPAPMGDPRWRAWRRSLWIDADPDSLMRIADTLAERGIWLEPLLVSEALCVDPYRLPVGLHRLLEVPFIVHQLRDREDRQSRTADDQTRLQVSLDRMRAFVARFHAAGGVLVTGSDGALSPGLSIHEEMRQLVLAGLDPVDALAAATREAARVLGVADSLGTLERGKIADLLILDGDPLDDISNTQLLYAVVKGGRTHDPATLLDDLADDLRDRATRPQLRLLVGLIAMVVALTALTVALRRHRASLPTSWRA